MTLDDDLIKALPDDIRIGVQMSLARLSESGIYELQKKRAAEQLSFGQNESDEDLADHVRKYRATCAALDGLQLLGESFKQE